MKMSVEKNQYRVIKGAVERTTKIKAGHNFCGQL